MKHHHFRSKDEFENMMGLSRPHFGSSWGLLGGYCELFGASRSTKEGLQIRLGTLLGLVCSLIAAEDGFGRGSGAGFGSFWVLLNAFSGVFRPPTNRFRP